MIKAKAATYVRNCLRWRFIFARLRRYLRLKTPHFAPKEQQQIVIVGGAGGRLAAQAHVTRHHRARVQPLDHAPEAQDSTETTGKGFKYVSVGRVQIEVGTDVQ
jgi:hypothetical protein